MALDTTDEALVPVDQRCEDQGPASCWPLAAGVVVSKMTGSSGAVEW